MKRILFKLSFILLIVLTPLLITPEKVFATPECQIFEPPREDYLSYYLVALKDYKVVDSLLFEYGYRTKGDTIICTRSGYLTELTIAKKNEIGNYLTNTCLETSNGIYLLRTKTYLNNKPLKSYSDTCSKENIRIEKHSSIPELYGFYRSFEYSKFSISIIEEIGEYIEYFVRIFPYNVILLFDLILTIGFIVLLRIRKLFKVMVFFPILIVIYLVLFYIYYNLLRLH